MKCPVCDHDMKLYKFDQCNLDQCTHCGGVWFEYGELKQWKVIDQDGLVEILHADSLTLRDDKKQLDCPTCGKAMNHYQYDYSSGIWIDRCNECKGVYMDHEDLKKLDHWLDNYHQWDKKVAEIMPDLHAAKLDVDRRYEELDKELDDLYISDDLYKKGAGGKMFKRMRDAFFINKLFK